jgi:geranylgeranylglycerol-phosphate geranylgeranyltransferase
MPITRRLRGFFTLSRPLNVVSAGLLTFLGAFVAGGAFEAASATLRAVGATFLAVAAGNAINDYYDRDVDAINRPDRPIPSGLVSPGEALAFSIGCFALAVAFAITLPLLAVGIAVVNLVALVLYTEFFKGLPGVGNAVVSYLGGSTFLFGAAAVGALGSSVGALALLAGIATFSREVIKDVEDVAGDSEEGLRTLPLVVGERTALLIATGALVVAVLASPLPFLLGAFGEVYIALVLPADAVMLYATVRAFSNPSVGQRLLKYGMLLAAAAFIGGRLSLLSGWPA